MHLIKRLVTSFDKGAKVDKSEILFVHRFRDKNDDNFHEKLLVVYCLSLGETFATIANIPLQLLLCCAPATKEQPLVLFLVF